MSILRLNRVKKGRLNKYESLFSTDTGSIYPKMWSFEGKRSDTVFKTGNIPARHHNEDFFCNKKYRLPLRQPEQKNFKLDLIIA